MTQSYPMTANSVATPTTDCIFATILGFMLPFFLAGAGGNQQIATIAIRELIDAYNARTATELDLVGRIVGFSIAAMDNLRLSMTPGLSDTKVLRYRANAVTLCRSSDAARKMLDALQAGQEVKRDVPRPSIAAAPPAPRPVPPVSASVTTKLPNAGGFEFPADIDTMKRDARTMMAAFSRNGAQGNGVQGTVSPLSPDTATMVRAAARAAVAAATRTPAA
jgi:hypothetical protein